MWEEWEEGDMEITKNKIIRLKLKISIIFKDLNLIYNVLKLRDTIKINIILTFYP